VGFFEVILEYVFRAIISSFKLIVLWVKTLGTSHWSCVEAIVTDQPMVSLQFGCPSVEVVYSYRIDGELYTGLHDEPFLMDDSQEEYIARFSTGRKFMVRVKPNSPEISIVREQDQTVDMAESRSGVSRP
jgi:hypothetical protein